MTNIWVTSDTPLAAFAVVSGLELVSVGPGDGRRFVYTFANPTDVGSKLRDWFLSGSQVSAFDYETARRTLLRKLHQAQHEAEANEASK